MLARDDHPGGDYNARWSARRPFGRPGWLRAMLKFANSVAGEQIAALLLPLSELQAEANLEVQRGRDLVPRGPPLPG
jgi:hypothetical protein